MNTHREKNGLRATELLTKILREDPDRALLCEIAAFLDPIEEPIAKLHSFTKAIHVIRMVRRYGIYKSTATVAIRLTPMEAKSAIRALKKVLKEPLDYGTTEEVKQYLSTLSRTINKITNAQAQGKDNG